MRGAGLVKYAALVVVITLIGGGISFRYLRSLSAADNPETISVQYSDKLTAYLTDHFVIEENYKLDHKTREDFSAAWRGQRFPWEERIKLSVIPSMVRGEMDELLHKDGTSEGRYAVGFEPVNINLDIPYFNVEREARDSTTYYGVFAKTYSTNVAAQIRFSTVLMANRAQALRVFNLIENARYNKTPLTVEGYIDSYGKGVAGYQDYLPFTFNITKIGNITLQCVLLDKDADPSSCLNSLMWR